MGRLFVVQGEHLLRFGTPPPTPHVATIHVQNGRSGDIAVKMRPRAGGGVERCGTSVIVSFSATTITLRDGSKWRLNGRAFRGDMRIEVMV